MLQLSAFNELKRIKITEYIPKWRYDEENGKCNTDSIPYENDFEDIDDIEENPFSDFDISKALNSSGIIFITFNGFCPLINIRH